MNKNQIKMTYKGFCIVIDKDDLSKNQHYTILDCDLKMIESNNFKAFRSIYSVHSIYEKSKSIINRRLKNVN